MNIFKKIETSLFKKKPFVVYKKPNSIYVNSFFQKNDEIYTSKSYTETGFIFAPFDSKEMNVIMPLSKSDLIEEEIKFKKEEFIKNKRILNEDEIKKQKHIKLVEKGIESIKENSFKKVVLSRKEEVLLNDFSVLETFEKLINKYTNAFVYVWFHPKVGMWIGATPETLLTTKGGHFTTMSLAGTQTLKKNINEVSWGDKELEEQQLVTDYLTRKLNTVTTDYTVNNLESFRIGNLLHLRTKVFGKYKGPIVNLIKLLHPTPAVCGFPMEASKKFILNNESYKRKFYTGFLGELNLKKSSNLYVNLRCMEIQNGYGIIYVGGGITESSNPEKEWEETIAKSFAIKDSI